MEYERGRASLVVSSRGLRSIVVHCNLGIIFFDNEFSAKKLAEEILEQVDIKSRIDIEEGTEIETVSIGKNLIENEEV